MSETSDSVVGGLAGAANWMYSGAAGFFRRGRGIGPSNAANNAAAFARYKDELRAAMSMPQVTNMELAQLLEKLYRPNAKLGSGSTAAAVRHELATGETVGGRTHSTKASEMITALQRWLKNNPSASPGDRAAAENVIQDMTNALNGN